MPTYEMPLLLRVMRKPELVATLKRATATIFNNGGFVRKIENWGERPLPCKTSVHGQTYKEANHFFIRFDVPPVYLEKIKDEYNRDIDIIRSCIFNENKNKIDKACTFHEEMLPPPYRPSVQKLVEMAKRQHNNKYKFKYNNGLDYYPFNK